MISASVGSADIVSFLLSSGAKIDTVDAWGYDALMYASKALNAPLETVQLLVDKGAYINRADRNLNTSFIYACKTGNYEVAKFLLRSGADTNIVNNSNMNAFDYIKDEIIKQKIMEN
jgi:ankyrin repeat protein